jgi:glycerol-3-phosphate dehydrogenase
MARASIKVLRRRRASTISAMRFGADLTAAEVRYLMTKEWAQTADDVLWRRSKLGLRFSGDSESSLFQSV